MLTLILGFNNSFKYVNFDTGAKSAELTSVTNLFHSGNQAWYIPLSLDIFSLGNFAPSAFWVLITFVVFFSLSSFNSSWVRPSPTVISFSCAEKLLQPLPLPY